jgi:hypothetical protein
MYRKWSRVVVMGIGAVVLCAALFTWRAPSLAQQPGGQPPGGGRERGRGGPGGFDFSQFIDRMLEGMQLNDAERAAAKETWTAKNNARNTLRDKISALREVAENPQSADADLKRSLSEFATAYATYAKAVSDADAKLVGKISLRTRARLTATGILENGVGFSGFRGGGGNFRRPGGSNSGGSRPGGNGGGSRPGGGGGQ